MGSLLLRPSYQAGAAFRRTRQITRVLLANGLETLVTRSGLRRFIPWWRRSAGGVPPPSEARRLRLALGELGVTFTKLGQMLSTRADLLPPEYIAELSMLQDAAPPVPADAIESIVRADLGGLPEWPFLSFERTPLASASIGQVHAAVLANGTPVVVKVRRPGVVEQVELDLDILRGIVDWAQNHTPIGTDYDLRSLSQTFSYTLRAELDYVHEAQNLRRMRRAFEGDAGVLVPRVYSEYSTERVLVMERMTGIGVSDVGTLDRHGLSRRAIAENAVRLFLRQVLEFGFFHADPHPGNFFVQPDGAIAIMDFGMVGHVNVQTQRRLLAAGLAAVRQDAEQLAEELYALGVAGERAQRAPFEKDLDHVLGRYGDSSMRELSAAIVVGELTGIAFRHKLMLPGELALLLRVITMSEGIGLRLDPEFHYLEYASGLIREQWRRRHSPQATVQRAGRALADSVELGLDLPRRASHLMSRLERGDVQMTVTHRGLREVTHEFHVMANRLGLAVILGSSIVALGLAAGIRHVPALEPVVAVFFKLAVVFSILAGASVVWGMWRGNHYR